MLSFPRLRVASGGFGRAIAPLARCARSLRSPWYFAASYPLKILYASMIFFCFCLCLGSFWMGKKLPNLCPIHSEKIYLTPPKIRAKTLPKSTPVRSKIEVWRGLRFKLRFCRVLGAAWGRPGAVLGRLGAVLGPSWGRLGAILRPSWGLLGPSWDLLGRSWGPLGAILGILR